MKEEKLQALVEEKVNKENEVAELKKEAEKLSTMLDTNASQLAQD